MNGPAKIMNGCRRPQRLVQMRSLRTPTHSGMSDEKMPSPPMANPMRVSELGVVLEDERQVGGDQREAGGEAQGGKRRARASSERSSCPGSHSTCTTQPPTDGPKPVRILSKGGCAPIPGPGTTEGAAQTAKPSAPPDQVARSAPRAPRGTRRRRRQALLGLAKFAATKSQFTRLPRKVSTYLGRRLR